MHFEVRDAQTTIYSFRDSKIRSKENHFWCSVKITDSDFTKLSA